MGCFFLCLVSDSLIAEDITSVSVKPLSELLIKKTESAPARIVTINHALLAAEINGRVTKTHVDIGDRVAQGQPLLEIDCRDYKNQRKQAEAALAAAQAQYELSKKQYKRNQSLSVKNTISQNNVDISLTQRNQASADVALKKAQLAASHIAIDKCLIKSPFQGQITEKLISLGDFLTPSKPVFRLLDTQASKIEAKLTPSKSQSIEQATTIEFVGKNMEVPLKLDTLVNIVDPQTNTLNARFSQKRPDQDLIIGLSGRVQWLNDVGQLPPSYIVRRNGALGVMITKDKKTASFHLIEDAIEGQSTTIGLPSETLVITNKLLTLQDADSILVE